MKLPQTAVALVAPAVVAAVALFAAAPAGAEGCRPIDSIPYTIDEPGLYCLVCDFQTDLDVGAAITVDADNVTIDFQQFSIDNRSAGWGTGAIGVQAYERSDVVVRNGTLMGFFEGVSLSGPLGVQTSNNHLVEDMRIAYSIRNGIGINGFGSVVRRNVVYETGNAEEVGTGIFLTGWRHHVVDNDVERVLPPKGSTGISFTSGGDNHLAENNRITSAETGIWMAGRNTKYRDNLTNEVGVPYTGGLDVGNNF
jgi:hypothetical protein